MNRIPRTVSLILMAAVFAAALSARAQAPATPPASTAAAPASATAPAPAPATAPASAPASAVGSEAAPAAGSTDFQTLDQQVQDVKKQIINLNRDLFVLEENLLFPANTQVAVYLSMDVGTFFKLDSVTLKIDDKEVANYLYTSRELKALLKGGVQRLYLGNQKIGKHQLVAFFVGKGPHGLDYRRGATITFDKGIGAKYLELKISDHVPAHQPEFLIKDWE
ncbi:MAG: AraC family transcriptional regulator [Gammaproteobacteria bacterium]|nr:AraC family transcriptional regulator [Gammaproteobacteria bacterium]